jgi:hypothetical protein
VSSRSEQTKVYNLEVEGYHNYAVGTVGVLVHNKGGAESRERIPTASASAVTVYGKVSLEHYEAAILGGSSGEDLLGWLAANGYAVKASAREVLDHYVRVGWVFVAVKLNPSERRHYENEPVPPLTITYQSDRLIFPLAISSVSTTGTVAISLYVVAEGTVAAENFPTRTLRYMADGAQGRDPTDYIERRIRATAGIRGRNLVVLWSGELPTGDYSRSDVNEVVAELTNAPAREKLYLTRLEARMDPSAMTDDIRFVLDEKPRSFGVALGDREGWPLSVGVKAEPEGYYDWTTNQWSIAGSARLTAVLGFAYRSFVTGQLDLVASRRLTPRSDSTLFLVEPVVNLFLFSLGPSLGWEVGPLESIPYVGFRVRFLDIPPILSVGDTQVDWGFDVLGLSLRWNTKSGKPIFSFGLVSAGLGRTFWFPD